MTHGKYFEELVVGEKFTHDRRRTVTEMDNVLFSSLTMNDQPLHIDAEFAGQTRFGQRVVNGIYVLGLVVGLSVSGLSQGTIVANLAFDHVVQPNPVFHGDTISCETEILDKRESKTKRDCGIVRLKHIGRKQDRTIVCECERTVMFLKRPIGD
ncbi:MAG: MaoC family dehydratase [Anaerolineae bacterium]|nr:MaoC family dehydratase [Anaerolineae bacterium]